MKWFITLFFVYFGCTHLSAQEYIVSGTVQDAQNKTLINGAKITIDGSTTKTNEKGTFSLKVKKGDYTINVAQEDYSTYTNALKVNRDLILLINLEQAEKNIQEVHLFKVHKNNGTMQVKTLDHETIQRNSTENLGNILANISGIVSLKTGNNISKPIIHGLYGSRISIIENGVKLAEQEWGVEHAPNVDVNSFDHVDVIKGASMLKYGSDGVGGVVVLEPSIIPKKDTLFGKVALSGISSGKGGELNIQTTKVWENQWFVKANGSFKKLGDLYIPHHTVQNTGTQINSFNFSFGKRTFMQGFEVSYSGIDQVFGIYTGSHLGSLQNFYEAVQYGQPFYLDDFSYKINHPKQEVNHHIAKLNMYKRWENIGKFTFQYAYQINTRREYDIRRGDLNLLPSMDLQLTTQTASLQHEIARDHWRLESGISGSYQDNFANARTKAKRLIPDYKRFDAGIYSVFQYHLSPKWTAELGARYDFSHYRAMKYYIKEDWQRRFASKYSRFEYLDSGANILVRALLDYYNFSANLGWKFKPNENLDFRLNLSRADRTPNPAELFADGLHHSAAIIETGNLVIKNETLYHVNLTAQAKIPLLSGLNLEVAPYYMYSDNYIDQVPTGIMYTMRGVFPVWDYQQIKARIFGLDVDYDWSLNRFMKLKGNYSILRGDDLSHDEPLILMMPTRLRNSIEFTLDKKRNFYVNIENESALTQKHYPIRNFNIGIVENGEYVTRVLDYSTPPKGYLVFHFSAGMDVAKNFNVNLRINNVFNKEYKQYTNRFRYFMPELGQNFVLTCQLQF